MTDLSLKDLKSRQFTLEELQAALIRFIEFSNSEYSRLVDEINKKQSKKWRATL